MMNKKIFVMVAMVMLTLPLVAQLDGNDVRKRLDLIHAGKTDEVRTEVTSLLRQIPNDPGVRYLDAYVTENGDQAVKKYQSFVDTFPQDEWADDALYKVYQYYYAVGLYKTADAKLEQLNKQYPNSIFAKKETPAAVTPPEKQEVKQEIVQQPLQKKSETPVQVPATGNYFVQVGVYSQETKAKQQAAELTPIIGKEATVFAKLSAGKTVYAVGFEGFTDEQSARVFGGELKSKFNLDWFVVKR